MEGVNDTSARRSWRVLRAPAQVLAACACCGLVVWAGFEHLVTTGASIPASAGYTAYQLPPSVVGSPHVPSMQAPQQVPQQVPQEMPQIQPAQVQIPQDQPPLTMPSMAAPRGSPSFMGAIPGAVSSPQQANADDGFKASKLQGPG